jgi:hypothetical protein
VTLSGLAAEPLSIALPRESPSRQAAFCRAAERPNRTAVNRVAGCYPAAAASPRARHTAAPHCLPRRSPRCLPHRLPRQPPSHRAEPPSRAAGAELLEPSCWSRRAAAAPPCRRADNAVAARQLEPNTCRASVGAMSVAVRECECPPCGGGGTSEG